MPDQKCNISTSVFAQSLLQMQSAGIAFIWLSEMGFSSTQAFLKVDIFLQGQDSITYQ